jgi:hypothetical protein
VSATVVAVCFSLSRSIHPFFHSFSALVHFFRFVFVCGAISIPFSPNRWPDKSSSVNSSNPPPPPSSSSQNLFYSLLFSWSFSRKDIATALQLPDSSRIGVDPGITADPSVEAAIFVTFHILPAAPEQAATQKPPLALASDLFELVKNPASLVYADTALATRDIDPSTVPVIIMSPPPASPSIIQFDQDSVYGLLPPFLHFFFSFDSSFPALFQFAKPSRLFL